MILLHICCAPCAIYPVREMRKSGIDLLGFFYNHNIHPYQEYSKRLDAVRQFAVSSNIDMIYEDDYDLEGFLAATAQAPSGRCRYCYRSRLEAAASAAVEMGCEGYSSSLLYSRYQQHALIRQLGEEIAQQHDISFYYDDFRRGWQEGITLSKKLGLYRQQYCGCIYSEKERYAPRPVEGTAS